MARSCMVLAPIGVSTTLEPEKHDFLLLLEEACCSEEGCAVAQFATEGRVDVVTPDRVPVVTCVT